MAKSALGTKRTCPDTGKKFYDLKKDPVVSPYTNNSWPLSRFEKPSALEADESSAVEVDNTEAHTFVKRGPIEEEDNQKSTEEDENLDLEYVQDIDLEAEDDFLDPNDTRETDSEVVNISIPDEDDV
ncbi:MAG: TIGR02300 family protein [Candidatus Liberibacter europaeus]|uniref:TIGR02300 family protein n=1 Tax=Candidatus Liberibacter europaeus TaxID=744859 RepID=A0A2T4VYW0_9HYPH|nr:TIGR02300 family protein [Candidatus Liberibacter europaeus]PTL86955.1 MAG: TIGR02300 family protein [Candidatus Liberibacter europaeus]